MHRTYVRASITIHCHVIHSFVMRALYLLFLPLSYCPVVPTTAADAPLIDYIVDDRTPLPSSFQASSAPSPLPHIAYLSLIICCTRHMLLLCYNPIQLHSLSLSPLDYLSAILCCPIYIIYSAVNPALCYLIGLDSGQRSLWE